MYTFVLPNCKVNIDLASYVERERHLSLYQMDINIETLHKTASDKKK